MSVFEFTKIRYPKMKKDKFSLNFVKLFCTKRATKLIISAIFNRIWIHFFTFAKNQFVDAKVFHRTRLQRHPFSWLADSAKRYICSGMFRKSIVGHNPPVNCCYRCRTNRYRSSCQLLRGTFWFQSHWSWPSWFCVQIEQLSEQRHHRFQYFKSSFRSACQVWCGFQNLSIPPEPSKRSVCNRNFVAFFQATWFG